MPLHQDIIERANARIGTVLNGKWRLDAVIGIGGMASVYAATHRNQARAAIKLLHREVAMDAEVTRRFLREGYVANAVGHPGTVMVQDDDIAEDHAPFLVMELLVGQTLDTMLAMAPEGLAVSEVLPLLDQLLDVMAAAHEKGIVHRDLKPENLFLTSEGRLKVLDFGIARLRELSAYAPSATQAGSVLGTPAFMAPEQALGRWHEVDGRTDIWAVGATAFTLLTGQFVHEAATIQEQLVLSATRPARALRDVKPQLPAGVAAVVDRALSFGRADRFPEAQSMRSALRRELGPALREPLSLTPPLTESARVSTRAEEHGPTLVAPLEVTSAITGRALRATGSPVTRSAPIGRRAKRRGPVVLAVAVLAMLGAGGAFALRWQDASREPLSARAAVVTRSPALEPARTPATAQRAPAPSVAPVLEAPRALTSVSSAESKHPPPTTKPAHVVHPSVGLPLPLPSAPPRPAIVTSKSLLGGDNPFDRRH